MTKIISISGTDGTGKTTQARLLSKSLQKKGLKVVTITTFEYFLLRPIISLYKKRQNGSSGGIVRKNSNFFLKLWFLPALLDIWAHYLLKVKFSYKDIDFLICDRCYHDLVANMLYYGYIDKRYYHTMLKLIPQPDIGFVLFAPPAKSLKQSGEFTLAYYQIQTSIYNELTRLGFQAIDAGKGLNDVHNKIIEKLHEQTI